MNILNASKIQYCINVGRPALRQKLTSRGFRSWNDVGAKHGGLLEKNRLKKKNTRNVFAITLINSQDKPFRIFEQWSDREGFNSTMIDGLPVLLLDHAGFRYWCWHCRVQPSVEESFHILWQQNSK